MKAVGLPLKKRIHVDENHPTGELTNIRYAPPKSDWMDPSVEFKKGTFSHAAPQKTRSILHLPNPRQWKP